MAPIITPSGMDQTAHAEGVESAAMIYDQQPIIDHFRRIDQRRVMGAMTVRGDEGIYFFELERVIDP